MMLLNCITLFIIDSFVWVSFYDLKVNAEIEDQAINIYINFSKCKNIQNNLYTDVSFSIIRCSKY